MTPELPPADLMTDRRRHTRRLAVKELIGLELGPTNRGIVVDLSEGGMRVQAAQRVQLLPSSLVRFQIPGCATPVAASCEVAWADHFGKAGLRFTGFSGNSQHDLRRWLMTSTAPVLVEKREEIGPVRTLPLPIPKPQVVTATAARATAGAESRLIPAEKTESFEARLHSAAQHLLKLTAADGAVVALREGSQIVCRASVGMAPAVGTPVQSDSGLAGECLRQGTMVWCRDTDNDPRVNRPACQKLRLRSTVLAPVLREGVVEGLVEIFSSRPDLFDRGDVLALTRMAEVVADMAGKPKDSSAGAAPKAEVPAVARPSREAALRLPQPVNGVLRCDACGHPNPERAEVCEQCDVPLRVPELEALLGRDPKVSKVLLAVLMVLAPLGCFYAGRETGALMQKKPAVQQQPAKSDVVRPERFGGFDRCCS